MKDLWINVRDDEFQDVVLIYLVSSIQLTKFHYIQHIGVLNSRILDTSKTIVKVISTNFRFFGAVVIIVDFR